ncbi:MAG: putative ABC transporter [Arenicellales bacterium IbO2]|nr:ATP-binding cassette domain-containing protein [Gammaproteobacteria bacterium]MDA7994680.1 ATP-binding cassette domain-containing protein [Gammaproteobacteria bacterium]MDA8023257.1 ATP-binding cassette domain-containing protein [Gammaproteobacteria bacterium]MDA8040960.1 ATP-binding cassette domain-containing protein [Pirellulales bacterium]CAJ2377143.1 MAG: putative ABC transporter [Arenicellales bacterium IbO2]
MKSPQKYYRVHSRTLVKEDDGNATAVRLRLNGDDTQDQRERIFFPASKGDHIRFSGKRAWVKLRNMDGEVQVSPAWSTNDALSINGNRLPLTIKEIETPDELEAYRALTNFHYRGRGGVGRRMPLIAKMDAWNLPSVVGFVELSSSLIVNVARKKILDSQFHDSTLGLKWKRWDLKTAQKHTNAIVRISRCVVYPELRGLGLAAKLTDAAVKCARTRWHMGGLRPCFIEIIAEMLRYWPFVEKSGFVKVGETEGNEKRAPGAMAYLLKRRQNGSGYPKGGGGIMSMHRMHAEKLFDIHQKRNISVDALLDLLNKSPEDLRVSDWVSLHDIYRRKKPTYMRGLTKSSKAHLQQRMRSIKTPKISTTVSRTGVLASVEGLCITARVKPRNSAECRRVQEAFGIVSGEFKSELMRNFSAEFNAGEITLVSGTSGVGKSLFLSTIQHVLQRTGHKSHLPKGIEVECKKAPKKARIVRLQNPPRAKAPIELLSSHSLDDAMQTLASAGLAEAHLFVRPAYALSLGQYYRLALAIALSKKFDIILIDEFCEPLDEYTTAVVCRKLRRIASKDGISVVVATADARHVSSELRPDRTLLLSSDGRHQWHKRLKIKNL